MGANQTPNALVCIVGPKEDFNQIAFGIDWESYLFYAAKFHQVQWVILTNGLQFKVLNCANGVDRQKFFKCELDEIIRDGSTDSFITLYKIFHVINTSNESKTSNQNPDIKKTAGKGKRVVAKRHLTRKEFWEQLISKSKSRTQLFSSRSPGIGNWLGIGAGKTGISYNYVIMKAGARVELYIDNGHADWNKSVFDSLSKSRTKIEEEFGHPLIWERLENKRASRVRFSLNQFGLQNNSKWPELQDQMIEAMIKFEKAFRPFIQKIG